MGRADSPLRGRMIFSFGVPRSGTWWLQRIVAAHPDVSAVPSESNLFSRAVGPMLQAFHHGARGSVSVGLMHADREDLLDATRDFCDRVLTPYLEPGRERLAERTSLHVTWVGTIADVYPDARLLHIVRDGRDVVRSLLARDWGPTTVAGAAEYWRSCIMAAREAAPGELYREVRYEDLLAGAEEKIAHLYGWLGLPVSPEAMEAALWEARLARNEDPSDPRLAAGKWRDAFTHEDLSVFLDVAGDLLAELGYAAETPASERARPSTLKRILPRRGPSRRPQEGRIAAVADPLMNAQRTVDMVLEAAHVGAPEGLRDHFAEDIRARIVTVEGDHNLYGPDAVIDWFRDDPAVLGHQLRADPFPGVPWYSVVLSYRLRDRSLESRVIEFTIRNSKVEELTLYRFPVG